MTRAEKQTEKARSAASRKAGRQEEDAYWAGVVRIQERREGRQQKQTPVGTTWERSIEGDCDLGELVRVTRNSGGDLYFCAAEDFDLPLHRRHIHLSERDWFVKHYVRKD